MLLKVNITKCSSFLNKPSIEILQKKKKKLKTRLFGRWRAIIVKATTNKSLITQNSYNNLSLNRVTYPRNQKHTYKERNYLVTRHQIHFYWSRTDPESLKREREGTKIKWSDLSRNYNYGNGNHDRSMKVKRLRF